MLDSVVFLCFREKPHGGNRDTQRESELGVWQAGCRGAGGGGHPALVVHAAVWAIDDTSWQFF